MAIYREYVQNSVDSFSSTCDIQDMKIEITLDRRERSVRIQDNGSGLTHKKSLQELLPIAKSDKNRESNRGFRGIGRLSGLAFSKSVVFTTRAKEEQQITRITWDGHALRNAISKRESIDLAIKECTTVEKFSSDEHPSHFFEVEIIGIERHAIGQVLNHDMVKNYISQVCPVPFLPDFPYATEVGEILRECKCPLEPKVILNGARIFRLHSKQLVFSESRYDFLSELETIRLSSADSDQPSAVVWITHSNYLGAIPKALGIRGIRAHAGNIQIGDETVFNHLFQEERFNSWCIGEIHILDHRIVPNGRRDYFEPGAHLRNLENQVSAIANQITVRCRTASHVRNQNKKFYATLQRLEDTYQLATSEYISNDCARNITKRSIDEICELRKYINSSKENALGEKTEEILKTLGDRFQKFSPRGGRPKGFKGIKASEIPVYRNVFSNLVQVVPSPQTAEKIIKAIIKEAQNIQN